MPELTLYNSLTKTKEPFEPLEKGAVGIYHCGPTVYKRPHLGNMRRFLFADFLRRTLEFLGYDVTEVTNITDVGHLTQDELDAGEDKLEKEAREQKATPQAIAEAVTKQYFADLEALNIQRSHEHPKATDHIAEMQDIIATLLEKGHAYQTDTGVYYDVTSFADYGRLSGNTLAAMEEGARVAVRDEKKRASDFALWKTDDPDHVQQWDSPWGRGYPGWHIECSAMSRKYLDQPFDIHTGGEDNKFPHHENEIAQSEGAFDAPLATYWLHNAHLRLGDAKVAKREGEQITIDSIRDRDISPLAFRLLSLGAHYRTPLEFSWEALATADEQLGGIAQTLRRLTEIVTSATTKPKGSPTQKIVDQFSQGLVDDLNTPQALAVLHTYLRSINAELDSQRMSARKAADALATLHKLDEVLGVIEPLLADVSSESVPSEVQAYVTEREEARAVGNFKEADELRQKIEDAGFTVEDTPAGPRTVKK